MPSTITRFDSSGLNNNLPKRSANLTCDSANIIQGIITDLLLGNLNPNRNSLGHHLIISFTKQLIKKTPEKVNGQ